MRIFLTLSASASSGFSDQTYKHIFYDTLVSMGHDVIFFPYPKATTGRKTPGPEAVSALIFSEFGKNHRQKPFDIFLSYYHAGQILPELFSRIREVVPVINYTTNFHQSDLYRPLLKEATLSLYVSAEAGPWFRENGFSGWYMPFAGLKRHARFLPEKNGIISFTGTSYGPRAVYLWRCLQNGLPVHVYGPNWMLNHQRRATLRAVKLGLQSLIRHPDRTDTAYRVMNDLVLADIRTNYPGHVHPPLSDEAYHDLLALSSVVLNFPESRHGHNFSNPKVLIGANLRDFEVPAAGSLLLTQDNEEIRNFFTPGDEIVTFRNEWEMTDKARHYIDHPEEALRIAKAGHRRAVAEHLWENRLEKLINHLQQNIL